MSDHDDAAELKAARLKDLCATMALDHTVGALQHMTKKQLESKTRAAFKAARDARHDEVALAFLVDRRR